jgi:SNF2 family DNA or RNA helicase
VYSHRHEGRGWVRVSWQRDARPDPEVSAALEHAARIPGVLRYDNAVSVSPTAFDVPEVQAFFDATRIDARRPKDSPNYKLPELPRPLYRYQREGAEKACASGSLLLADPPGFGKTPQAIAAALTLAHGRTVVIVGPLFTRDVWRRELLVLGVPAEEFCALASRDMNDASWNPDAKWFFVHYDVVAAWQSRFSSMPFDRRPAVVIVDEAHYCKNPKALRTKGVYLLASTATHRLVLTGTPLDAKPFELFSLLRITTGPQTWGSTLDFRKRYCGAEHDGYHWVDREPTHIEELLQRMAPWYLRRTEAEAGLELPPLTRTVYTVDLDEKALAAHADVLAGHDLRELVRAVARGDVTKDTLALITALRKITSKAKQKATQELVESLYDQGEHVVVFTWERERASAVCGFTAKYNPIRTAWVVTGEHPQDYRDILIGYFQNEPVPAILAATYGALREGVTLHRARTVVLHDLDWQLTGMLQAEGRVRRIGQRRPCQSLWMVAKGTVDELIARTLLIKAEVLQSMLGTVDQALLDDTAVMAKAAGVELGQEHVDRIIGEWLEARA